MSYLGHKYFLSQSCRSLLVFVFPFNAFVYPEVHGVAEEGDLRRDKPADVTKPEPSVEDTETEKQGDLVNYHRLLQLGGFGPS